MYNVRDKSILYIELAHFEQLYINIHIINECIK